MSELEKFVGDRKTGSFTSFRHFSKDPKKRQIIIEVAKEAEEKNISDTAAAEFIVKHYEEFNHLSPHTVRRYFHDYRAGLFV